MAILPHELPHLFSSASSACHFVSTIFVFLSCLLIGISLRATRFSGDSVPTVVATSIGCPLWCDGINGLVRTFVVHLWSTSHATLQNSVRQWYHLVFMGLPVIIWRISATMLAPTPLLAANFMIFGEVIKRLGISNSRLTPRWCKYPTCGWYIHKSVANGFFFQTPFCSLPRWVLFRFNQFRNFISHSTNLQDILSLFVQGAGGGVASGAKDAKGQKLVSQIVDPCNLSKSNSSLQGSDIMLAGIIFQLGEQPPDTVEELQELIQDPNSCHRYIRRVCDRLSCTIPQRFSDIQTVCGPWRQQYRVGRSRAGRIYSQDKDNGVCSYIFDDLPLHSVRIMTIIWWYRLLTDEYLQSRLPCNWTGWRLARKSHSHPSVLQ